MRNTHVALIVFLISASCAFGFNLDDEVAELRLKDGQVLHGVKFMSFASKTVMAKWTDGRGTIAYENLPDEYVIALKDFIPSAGKAPAAKLQASGLGAFKEFIRQLPVADKTAIPAVQEPKGERQIMAGQCFIVTKGGTNYKLGLVNVSIYSAQNFAAYREEVVRRTKARLDTLGKCFDDNTLTSHQKILLGGIQIAEMHDRWDMLPEASASATTDADGNFTLTHNVPPPFVVFARASRTVGEEKERYIWEVSSGKIKDPSRVFLSNDNMN